MLGTGVAQLLPFLATPLLTRLFSEEDFALYTSFFAIATIFAVAVGGKYQMAIVLPKGDLEAQKLLELSNVLTLVYSALIALVLVFGFNQLPFNLGNALYFIPVFVIVFGFWSSFTNYAIRKKMFKHNAFAKVIQSLSYIVGCVAFGLAKHTLYGLIFAKILGTLVASIFLLKKYYKEVKSFPLNELKCIALRYIDYPKYGVAPALLNTISSQGIILILTKFYSLENLGHFGLTNMVITAPLGLIGVSYKDVFYQKIAEFIKRDQLLRAIKFFKNSAFALFAMGFPISLVLFFFGEHIFSFVFGVNWLTSGTFAAILAFSFLARLIVSPLSSIFNAANKIKIASVWQTAYFITTFSTLGLCSFYLKLDIINLLKVYVVHEVIMYSLYFILEYRTLKQLSTRKINKG